MPSVYRNHVVPEFDGILIKRFDHPCCAAANPVLKRVDKVDAAQRVDPQSFTG